MNVNVHFRKYRGLKDSVSNSMTESVKGAAMETHYGRPILSELLGSFHVDKAALIALARAHCDKVRLEKRDDDQQAALLQLGRASTGRIAAQMNVHPPPEDPATPAPAPFRPAQNLEGQNCQLPP